MKSEIEHARKSLAPKRGHRVYHGLEVELVPQWVRRRLKNGKPGLTRLEWAVRLFFPGNGEKFMRTESYQDIRHAARMAVIVGDRLDRRVCVRAAQPGPMRERAVFAIIAACGREGFKVNMFHGDGSTRIGIEWTSRKRFPIDPLPPQHVNSRTVISCAGRVLKPTKKRAQRKARRK